MNQLRDLITDGRVVLVGAVKRDICWTHGALLKAVRNKTEPLYFPYRFLKYSPVPRSGFTWTYLPVTAKLECPSCFCTQIVGAPLLRA